jgi:hypothetical protein
VLVGRPSCCLNDAPCPPLTSHGASIAHPLLAVCLVFLVCFVLERGAPIAARAPTLLWRLNDAPCPPFTSHGASIMLGVEDEIAITVGESQSLPRFLIVKHCCEQAGPQGAGCYRLGKANFQRVRSSVDPLPRLCT